MNTPTSSMYRYLIQGSYPRFFMTGASGAVLNVLVTWVFTEYVFGRPDYFYAYTLGLVANILYNFVMHTFLTFKTTQNHVKRFSIFFGYSIFATYLQAVTVKALVPVFGLHYYIIVIAGTILVYSFVNFFVFKTKIFKE